MNALQIRKIELEKEEKEISQLIYYQNETYGLFNKVRLERISKIIDYDVEYLEENNTRSDIYTILNALEFKREKLGAELKGINLGLKVLEDYSRQDNIEREPQRISSLLNAPADNHNFIGILGGKCLCEECEKSCINTVNDTVDLYSKGYQDAIKEVLDKMKNRFAVVRACKCNVCKNRKWALAVIKEELNQKISEVKNG